MNHFRVYQAPSGQWSFKIYEDDVEIIGGGGFASESEAFNACMDTVPNNIDSIFDGSYGGGELQENGINMGCYD